MLFLINVFFASYISDKLTPWHSYGVSLAIWDHSVTFHPSQVNTPRLNPSQTGQYSIYLPWKDGRLSWPRWTECHLPYGIRVLPSTRHKWIHPALTPARQVTTRFTYPRKMEGWVDLGDLLHTEMVYPPAEVTHPSTNRAQCRLTTWIEAPPMGWSPPTFDNFYRAMH